MRSRRYNMVEMVAALALLAILMTAVVTGLSTAGEARVRMTQESRAILVLENAVTSLGSQQQWSEASVQALLASELAAVSMPRRDGIRVTATRQGEGLALAVVDAQGRSLAVVMVPLGGQP